MTLPNTIPLPLGWVRLAPPGTDPVVWTEAYLDGHELEPAARRRLRHGILAVLDLAAGMRPGERHNFAFIDEPSTGLVRALLSAQLMHVTPEAYDNYRARLEETGRAGRVDVINRTVEERAVPSGRVIVLHDFTLAGVDQVVPDPALERTILGLFVDGTDALLELALYTQDLALFDDMAGYATELAASFVTGVPA